MKLDFRKWFEANITEPEETLPYVKGSSHETPSVTAADTEDYYPTGFSKGHIWRGDPEIHGIQRSLQAVETGDVVKNRDVRGMLATMQRFGWTDNLADIAMSIAQGNLEMPTPEQARRMQQLADQEPTTPGKPSMVAVAKQLRIYDLATGQSHQPRIYQPPSAQATTITPPRQVA